MIWIDRARKLGLLICLAIAWGAVLEGFFGIYDGDSFIFSIVAFSVLTVFLWKKIDKKFFK